MRIIIISDLHIKANSNVSSEKWVDRFCKYIKTSGHSNNLIIIVLGDIIDNDGKNGTDAFTAAHDIFIHIESELTNINYKICFIPGNHDYCDNSLIEFDKFTKKHQTLFREGYSFASCSTINIVLDSFNLILTDSIQNNDYSKPGVLDLKSIKNCIDDDKENILFLHHSMVFEDGSDHTGILNYYTALNFLRENNINFVFHGHTHATRNSEDLQKPVKVFGIGAIGNVENPGKNESEQFLKINISEKKIESISNYLFRAGTEEYDKIIKYPKSEPQYESIDDIKPIIYKEPDNYIIRNVLPVDEKNLNMNEYFLLREKTTLYDAVSNKNKLVILLADSGMGKTEELKYLASKFSDNKSVRPILLALSRYNGEKIIEYINVFAPNYDTLDPNRFVLIMDGYDEITDKNCFLKELSSYIENNPLTHICISMRNNFLPGNFDKINKFKKYRLSELEHLDVENELRKKNINLVKFFSECKNKGLDKILYNPFYLSKIIELYKQNENLPNKSTLIADFIDIIVNKDLKKFQYIEYLDENNIYEIKRAIMRFAIGLQLLDKTYCANDLFGNIISDMNDRKFIQHCSLIEKNESGYYFNHNVFKEYFVAKYISSMEYENIIEYISIPNTNSLNPNCFNIIGMILQLNENNDVNKKLFDWVEKSAPFSLISLEPGIVNDDIRNSIFINTLDNIVEREIWFNEGKCSIKKFTAFVESEKILNRIITTIENNNNEQSLYFCLKILFNFSYLYGKNKKVKELLENCYYNNAISPYCKRIAITSIAKLGLNTNEITEKLSSCINSISSSNVRLGIYEYFLLTELCDEKVDLLLKGLEIKKNTVSDKNVFSEIRILKECLLSISNPNAVEKVINWFGEGNHIVNDYFYNDKRTLSSFFDKAIEVYNNGNCSIYEGVYKCLLKAIEYYKTVHLNEALLFFEKIEKLEEIFERILTQSEKIADIVTFIKEAFVIKPNLLDILIKKYLDDSFKENNIFKFISLGFNEDSDEYNKCKEAIKKKTGEILKPKVIRDYELERKKDIQKFFNCLFDKEEMQKLLCKLANCYGNIDITFEEFNRSNPVANNYSEGTIELETALFHSNNKDEKIIDFIKSMDLETWNYFIIDRICYLFNNENAGKVLEIDENQKIIIYELYKKIEENLVYSNEYEEPSYTECKISNNFRCYQILKYNLDFTSPKEYYLGLLEIPFDLQYKVNNVKKKLEIIENNIDKSEIASRIKSIVLKEKRVRVIIDLLFICKEYKIKECKQLALKFCGKTCIDSYYREKALDYLLQIFGEEIIILEVMPFCDDTLFESIVTKLFESKNNKLIEEIKSRYNKNNSEFLLKHLILSNSPEGLRNYIEKSKEMKCNMDYSGYNNGKVTQSISAINDIKLLSLLLDAVRMRYSGDYHDNTYYQLSESLFNAILNCSNNNSENVINEIENLKKEKIKDKKIINFCNTLIDRIKEKEKLSLIQPKKPSSVREILNSIV